MSRIWLSSDWHFNHPFVAKLRGFESSTDHDAALIGSINELVGPRDTLWFLGDLHMKDLTDSLYKVDQINGTKHMIFGNHDGGHPMHRRAQMKHRQYLESFQSVGTVGQLRFGQDRMMLSHFPYTEDHTEGSRFMEWRLRDEGLMLAHGHVHSEYLRSHRGLNVGVDWAPAIQAEDVYEQLRNDL